MKKTVIIGAGIVGLSCAFYLMQSGRSVMLVDPEPEGDKASFGNAAGLAVTECIPAGIPGLMFKLPKMLLDPLGPLFIKPSHIPRMLPWLWSFQTASTKQKVFEISKALGALNDRTYRDFQPIIDTLDYGNHIHHKGCLVAYRDEASFQQDQFSWNLKRQNGVRFDLVKEDDLRDLEPNLGPNKTFAVFAPDWSHISSPQKLMQLLLNHYLDQGGELVHQSVRAIDGDDESAYAILDDGTKLEADNLVVAAGAWSGQLAKSIGDHCLLESERGYNTTLPAPGIHLTREIIFAEEMFVATPISEGLRIGGAAEFAGLKSPANYNRSRTLVKLAQNLLPDLKADDGNMWMGHRPLHQTACPSSVLRPTIRAFTMPLDMAISA